MPYEVERTLLVARPAMEAISSASLHAAPTMFDDAWEEIFTLVARDTLPRFRTSEAFEELRNALGAHAEDVCFEDEAALDAAIATAGDTAGALR